MEFDNGAVGMGNCNYHGRGRFNILARQDNVKCIRGRFKMIKTKKGDSVIESRLVEVLLFAVVIAIIIYVVVRVITMGDVDKSVCQQSIANRAMLTKILPSYTKEFVPLKCKTVKYCITGSSGKCESAYGSDLKGVKQIRVANTEQIEKFLAEEMLACWTMTGKGELSVFSQYWASEMSLGKIYPTCVICDRIAFDLPTLTDIEMKDIDMLRYMASHKIPQGDVSYLAYFGVENGKIGGLQKSSVLNNLVENLNQLKAQLEEDTNEDLKEEAAAAGELADALTAGTAKDAQEDDKIGVNKTADSIIPSPQIGILFMQISAPGYGSSLANIGKNVLGIGTASYLTSSTVTLWAGKKIAATIIKNPFAAFITVVAGAGIGGSLVSWNQQIAAGYCGDYATGGEARSGCSIVRLVDYNPDAIRSVCRALEST